MWGGREGERSGGGRPGEGWEKPRNAHLPRTTSEATSNPPPAAPPAAAAKPSRSLCKKAAQSECRLPLATPGSAATAGEPRGSVSLKPPLSPPLSPLGPPPAPRAPRTLSNPLGSRWLLRETLAKTGAGTTRLQAGRWRGTGYGEPSNEMRAGAQRRQVLAEYGRGAAAGAQGPLHHWQPGSPSIFLPQAGASARHTSSESRGPALEPSGRALTWRVRAAPILFLRSLIVLTPLLSRPGQEGGH